MPNNHIALCKCRFLEQQANQPDSPLKFDNILNEYNFLYPASTGDTAKLTIYHCPFCGGRAPKSKRATLFATLTTAEQQRLVELTKGLRTFDEVLMALGQPDLDNEASSVWVTPERNEKPETTQSYRTLVYTKLSDTADIYITVDPTDRVAITFMEKYIGPGERVLRQRLKWLWAVLKENRSILLGLVVAIVLWETRPTAVVLQARQNTPRCGDGRGPIYRFVSSDNTPFQPLRGELRISRWATHVNLLTQRPEVRLQLIREGLAVPVFDKIAQTRNNPGSEQQYKQVDLTEDIAPKPFVFGGAALCFTERENMEVGPDSYVTIEGELVSPVFLFIESVVNFIRGK